MIRIPLPPPPTPFCLHCMLENSKQVKMRHKFRCITIERIRSRGQLFANLSQQKKFFTQEKRICLEPQYGRRFIVPFSI